LRDITQVMPLKRGAFRAHRVGMSPVASAFRAMKVAQASTTRAFRAVMSFMQSMRTVLVSRRTIIARFEVVLAGITTVIDCFETSLVGLRRDLCALSVSQGAHFDPAATHDDVAAPHHEPRASECDLHRFEELRVRSKAGGGLRRGTPAPSEERPPRRKGSGPPRKKTPPRSDGRAPPTKSDAIESNGAVDASERAPMSFESVPMTGQQCSLAGLRPARAGV
jgi:hypothetical protein